MLNDVFSIRYEDRKLFTYGEKQRRFMVQASLIITKQIFPTDVLEDRLATVLGQFAMEIGKPVPSGAYKASSFVTFFAMSPENGLLGDERTSDAFVKHRISLIELAFRRKKSEVDSSNKVFDASTESPFGEGTVLKHLAEMTRASNNKLNSDYNENVDELNARLSKSGLNLSYHNGFIQLSDDPLAEKAIHKPFWSIVALPMWGNVDTDMKEAIDRRDNRDRDASFYAAKALESTLKIISAEKGLTRGTEKGASNFIDNLVSAKNGRVIESWEAEALKAFFGKVRNPLGHGPGGEPMPQLTIQQENWAIETCMSWIKSLTSRI